MAKKLYEESNIQAIADAIRGKNGESTKYKTSEMAAAISAIEAGSGENPLELVYEGRFTINETSLQNVKVDVAVLNTGLTLTSGESVWCVIQCINNTWDDTTTTRCIGRTQLLSCYGGTNGMMNTGLASGIIYTSGNQQSGTGTCFYVSAVGRKCASLTISTKYSSSTLGAVASGDYSVKLYKFNPDILGYSNIIVG